MGVWPLGLDTRRRRGPAGLRPWGDRLAFVAGHLSVTAGLPGIDPGQASKLHDTSIVNVSPPLARSAAQLCRKAGPIWEGTRHGLKVVLTARYGVRPR